MDTMDKTECVRVRKQKSWSRRQPRSVHRTVFCLMRPCLCVCVREMSWLASSAAAAKPNGTGKTVCALSVCLGRVSRFWWPDTVAAGIHSLACGALWLERYGFFVAPGVLQRG